MTMLQQSMGRINNLGPSSNNSTKKLLDIHINFDERYPVVTYTYFDKENKTEIIETYMSFNCSIEQEHDFESGRYDFFDIILKCKNSSLISKEIKKLS